MLYGFETCHSLFLGNSEWKQFKIPFIKETDQIKIEDNIVSDQTASDSLSGDSQTFMSSNKAGQPKDQFLMVSPLAVNECTPMIIDSIPHVLPVSNSSVKNKRKVPDAGYVVSQHIRSLGQLPTDLTKLFLPLFCELCGIHSNSPISARAHYTSVGHDKKIKAWLVKREQEMGEPCAKKTKVMPFETIKCKFTFTFVLPA